MKNALITSLAGLMLLVNGMADASTTDHMQFKELQGPFASGPEVTKACLACHNKAADEVRNSIHGTWEYDRPKTGQKLGKRNSINAFCGNVVSNEPRCTSCHPSYDWRDMNKEPPSATDDSMVDCLVCHDTTGIYSKWPTGAGHPLYKPKTKGGKTTCRRIWSKWRRTSACLSGKIAAPAISMVEVATM